jgi:hypothetical protein
MTPVELHGILRGVFHAMITLRHELPADLKPDTAFAIGEATATIGRAKALVARDIDDAESTS